MYCLWLLYAVSDCAIETTLSVVVFSADECIEDRRRVDESIRKGSGTKWRNKTHFNHAQRRRSLGGHFFPLNNIRVCVQNSVLCTVEVLYIQLLMYNGLSRILFVALISLFCSACVRSSLLGKFRRFWCRLVCLLPFVCYISFEWWKDPTVAVLASSETKTALSST